MSLVSNESSFQALSNGIHIMVFHLTHIEKQAIRMCKLFGRDTKNANFSCHWECLKGTWKQDGLDI